MILNSKNSPLVGFAATKYSDILISLANILKDNCCAAI